MGEKFEPKILAFLCNWCSYAGADMAGVSRIQYPPNIRVIRVMCSARVDAAMILKVFYYGGDGVLVSGCHPGDCHYIAGNYHAQRKMKMAKRMLTVAGIHPDRLTLEWVSAAEGARFAELVTGFVEKIKELGPLGHCEGIEKKELELKLSAACEAMKGEKLRWLVGMERRMVEEENRYGEKLDQIECDRAMDVAIRDEFMCNQILLLTKDEGRTVKEIAGEMAMDPGEITDYMIELQRSKGVSQVDMRGRSPVFSSSHG